MCIRISPRCLSLILFMAALTFLHKVDSYEIFNVRCSAAAMSDCPQNLYNALRCRRLDPKWILVLEKHTCCDTVQSIMSEAVCAGSLSNSFIYPADSISIQQDTSLTNNSCTRAVVELTIRFGGNEVSRITIGAIDFGRVRVFQPIIESELGATFRLEVDVRQGLGGTIRMAVMEHGGSLSVFQCFLPVPNNCLDTELYERCGHRIVTDPPPTPSTTVAPTTASATTTTSTTTTSTTTTTTTRLTNTTAATVPTTIKVTVDNTTLTLVSEGSSEEIVNPRSAASEKPTRSLSTKETKPGDRAIVWQALFMSVGVVVGIICTAMVIFILVKCKPHIWKKKERQKHRGNTSGPIQNSEGIPIQDLEGDGYEVPRQWKPNQLRKQSEGLGGQGENIYDIIKDEEEKL